MDGEGEREVRLLSWLNSSGALVSLREQSSQYTAARDKVSWSLGPEVFISLCHTAQVVYRLCLEIDPLGLLQFNGTCNSSVYHC